MGTEIQEVFDQIVVIQNAITPPTGEKDIAFASDELPPDLTVFPTFLNVETDADIEPGGSTLEIQLRRVEMHLVLGGADRKYSMRSRRLWEEKVLAAFRAKLTLNSTCTQALIKGITYDTPLPWNQHEYLVATFRLVVEVKKVVAYAI